MEKKHPIDNLFSERLHNYERQPSAAAWQKLQGRLESKKSRRIGGWMIYTIAASVALLLVAGLWISNQNDEAPQVAQVKNQGKTLVPKAPKSAVPIVPNSTLTPQQSIAINRSTIKVQSKQVPQKPTIATSEAIAKNTAINAVPPMPKQGQDVTPTIEKTMNQSIAQEIRPTPPMPKVTMSEEKAKPTLAETPILAKAEPTKENTINTTLVVNIGENTQSVTELTNDNNANAKKNSRIARIFKQLKKAKEGEKVDWDEVGFNPNRLIAKADELVHPKGKSTESQNR
ncbi:MAG: hypothetical protein U0Y10_02525 [Spirosomataceae bacterium]